MTRAKARRLARRLDGMVECRNAWLDNGVRTCSYSKAGLREERDFLASVAVELRAIAEGRVTARRKKVAR